MSKTFKHEKDISKAQLRITRINIITSQANTRYFGTLIILTVI
jgi:hypothetical protein